MTVRGHVKNGVIVLDESVPLPEGAYVQVEVLSPVEPLLSSPARQGGWWKGKVEIAPDFDELPDEIAESFGTCDP